jgi:hypothetical protein
VATCSICSSGSFEVAWRSSASSISSGLIPQPSSVTSIIGEPARQAHGNVLRPGIDRVLDQFLERRSGPLDHLARGDAVDEVSGRRRMMGMATALAAKPAQFETG